MQYVRKNNLAKQKMIYIRHCYFKTKTFHINQITNHFNYKFNEIA